MVLENQRTQYAVTNEDSHASLRGEISFNETSKQLSINGSVSALGGENLGSFYYNLNENKNIDQNFNSVKDESFDIVETIVDTTITEIREHFNV